MPQETEQPANKVGKPNQAWRVLAHRAGERIEIENQGEIDEVVIQHWFHLEELAENHWWLRLGDARIFVRIGDGGKEEVEIERGFYGRVNGKTTTIQHPDETKV